MPDINEQNETCEPDEALWAIAMEINELNKTLTNILLHLQKNQDPVFTPKKH